MSLDKPNLDYIRPIYRNKRLKKIVNVYQQNYANGTSMGFGDCIRGSFYLFYVCKLLHLEFDIDLINHPISKYFKHNISTYNINYLKVESYIDYNNNEEFFMKNLIATLNNYDGEIFYLFNNSFNRFNYADPKFNLIQGIRDTIIPKIEPNDYLLEQLDNKLDAFGLKRNRYGVIHVRAGDYFMNIKKTVDSEKHKISLKHLNDIITLISGCCSMEKKYILIGDSAEIKRYISNKFSNILSFETEIAHLGESIAPSDKAIMETILDFSIMRFSNCIISFSAYAHGSGFSQYCSKLYGIPFKQIILTPTLTYNI